MNESWTLAHMDVTPVTPPHANISHLSRQWFGFSRIMDHRLISSVIICPTAIAYSMEQIIQDAQLWHRDRAAGCVTVFAKSRRLELENNIYGHYRSIFNHCDIIGLKICRIPWKKRKMRVITAFKVIQGPRGRYQSKARMRFAISD